MDDFHVYKDIEARTGGEIYVSVGTRTHREIYVYQAVYGTSPSPNLPDGQKSRDQG